MRTSEPKQLFFIKLQINIMISFLHYVIYINMKSL